MTTRLDLIHDTRRHLMTGQPDRLNLLLNTIDGAQGSLELQYEPKGVAEGATLVIDLEEFYVVSHSVTGDITTCNVIRGYNGSIPTEHIIATIVYVNPHFSSFAIDKSLQIAMGVLTSRGLFKGDSGTLTANSTVAGYDVDLDDFIDIIRVSHSVEGPSEMWPVLRRDQYYMDNFPDTTTFPSGRALFLREGIRSGRSINVVYKRNFAPFSDILANPGVYLDDDILVDVGLHTEAHDLPALSAAINLLSGREVKRSFLNRQPEPRRQEEVPPGSANQAMIPLIKRFDERMVEEVTRLDRLYPTQV